ncbi:MAG: hypothetical protein ABIF77_13735 [bacterium]
MKPLFTCLLLCLFVIAAPPFSGADPGTDGVGIYFDLDGQVNCLDVPPFTPVNCYVIATNVSSPGGVLGYAFTIATAGPFLLGNYTQPCINIIGWPDIACGLSAPYPWAPTIVLISVSFMVMSPEPVYLSVLPYSFGSVIPGFPVYEDGDAPGTYRALFPAAGQGPGGEWLPVACVNGDCPVPTESETWGGLKALYR